MALSLTYYPGLYLGESIPEEKLDKIKKRLEKKPLLSQVILLTISRNASDQLEIFSARQLAQKCLKERGDCSLKEYLLCSVSC